MKNEFDAVVETCDRRDSHAWLRIGRARLAARFWPGIARGRRVRVFVRAEDVVLCAGHPGPTSARNVLPGHVGRVRRLPDGVEVTVNVGFPLVALVTRRSARDLRIRRGAALYALLKATAVTPVVTAAAKFRVSLRGARGWIDPAKIDLLRAVDREGSLSRAAAVTGVSYRTAWLWSREIHRAWGEALLHRSADGTRLTPAGLALLRTAGSLERNRR